MIRAEFPDVELEHMLVDSAAMHLLKRPRDFDVMLTENMFGDILTDEGADARELARACCRRRRSATAGAALYEPIHGSAPDIAGQGHRESHAARSSASRCCCGIRWGSSAKRPRSSRPSTAASPTAPRTADIAEHGRPAMSTRRMGDAVVDRAARLDSPRLIESTYLAGMVRHTRWYGDPWPIRPRIPNPPADGHHRPGARQRLRRHAH